MRGASGAGQCFVADMPTKERCPDCSVTSWTEKTAMSSFKSFTATICVLLAGCTQQPGISPAGQRFVLSDEPAGAVGILDYRESKPEAGEVSLIGRVGLEALKWSNQSAMFV